MSNKLWKSAIPYCIIIVLAVAFIAPLFTLPAQSGGGDWDLFCFFDEVPRITILEYGQFPLWNPYASGGRPMLANPLSGFLRPTFILPLIFGCILGIKIESFLTCIIAMIGMFLLSRHFRLRKTSALVAASIFGLSSAFALRIVEGHVPFFTYAILPYLVLFFLKSLEDRRHIISSSVCIALIILGEGTVHVLIPTLVFLSAFATMLAIQKRSFAPIIHFAIIVLLAFSLTAIKSIPTLTYLSAHPRPVDDPSEFVSLKGVYDIFLSTSQKIGAHNYAEQKWYWHEYGAYVGFIPALLALLGLALQWKKQWPLLMTGLLAFLVVLGNVGPWAPWNILRKMPLISSTHIPSRFVLLVVFVIATFAAFGTDNLMKQTKRHNLLGFGLLILLVIVPINLLLIDHNTFDSAFTNIIPPVIHDVTFVNIRDNESRRSGGASSMLLNLKSNHGTINAYDSVPNRAFAYAREDSGYRGELHLETLGNASYKYWSPNKLIININVPEPTRLVINQNYDSGWHVLGNNTLEEYNGLLSARVNQESKELTLTYMPWSFLVGAVTSLVAIIAAVSAFFICWPKWVKW